MQLKQLFVLLSLVVSINAQGLCFGTSNSLFDDWCNHNCNNVPPFCPSSFCTCQSGPQPTPSVSTNAPSTCTSLVQMVPDSWCESMCHHTPSYCPPSFCSCTSTNPATPVGVAAHEYGCCGLDRVLYFISNQNVYRVTTDVDTRLPSSSVDLCASFLNPVDIEIANDEGVFVVDSVASRVYRIAPNCGAVQVILDWTTDGFVAHPRAVSIGDNGLYVSDNDRIYFVTLDANFAVISVVTTVATLQGPISMDNGPNGLLYFIEPGYVRMYNPSSHVSSTYATLRDFGWADVSGIRVTSCGVYLTITDNNQVWRCTDLTNSSSCHVACIEDPENLGASSCQEIRDPYGITTDCNCGSYSAQQAGGQLVYVNPEVNQTVVIETGLYHPYDVEIYDRPDCHPSGTPSGTPVVTPTPTQSKTSTPTPTQTRTKSPSPSPTVSYQLAIRIDDYNAACASGQCGLNETLLLQEAGTTRKFGINYLLNFDIALIGGIGNAASCFNVLLQGSTFICQKLIDPTTFTSQNYGSIKLYVTTASGLNPPSWLISPAVFGSNVFPNASSNKIVAGQFGCTNYNGISVRIVLTSPLPCWNDSTFGVLICQVGKTSATSDASSWTNGVTTQGAFDPYHEVVCVSDNN